MVAIDVKHLPGALQDFLPFEVTQVGVYINPLSRCLRPEPHNMHRYGEGMQAQCVGVPGTAPAVSVEALKQNIEILDRDIENTRERIARETRHLEDRVLQRHNKILALHIIDSLHQEAS